MKKNIEIIIIIVTPENSWERILKRYIGREKENEREKIDFIYFIHTHTCIYIY